MAFWNKKEVLETSETVTVYVRVQVPNGYADKLAALCDRYAYIYDVENADESTKTTATTEGSTDGHAAGGDGL